MRRTWCFTAKEQNVFHSHAHQVWRIQKLYTHFDPQVMKMILSECEDSGVNTVGGVYFQSRHELDKNDISHQNGRLHVGVTGSVQEAFIVRLPWWICVPNFVLLCTCGRCGWTIGGATEPTCHDHAQWQCRIALFARCAYVPNLVSFGVCSGPQNCSQSERSIIIITKNSFSYNSDLTGRWPVCSPVTCMSWWGENKQ